MKETTEGGEGRSRRLDDLARRIAAGGYEVPALRVADAILASHRTGRSSSRGDGKSGPSID